MLKLFLNFFKVIAKNIKFILIRPMHIILQYTEYLLSILYCNTLPIFFFILFHVMMSFLFLKVMTSNEFQFLKFSD